MSTTDAVLFISNPGLMSARIGGLSVLERQLFTASRAGIRRLWISASEPEKKAFLGRLPAGLEIRWSKGAEASGACAPPYLVVSGDHFIQVETLRYIVEAPYGEHAVLEDASGAPVVQVIPFGSEKIPARHKQRLPEGSCVPLEMPASRGTLAWLLASGTKGQDGFMARHFDRHISLAISRLLLDTSMTPNAMTFLSSLIGLAGTAFFLETGHARALAGAFLVWLHSVLDGCDGELARIRFQESAWGADIDFWGDNLVHLSLFGCLAIGFSRADRSALPLVLGAGAALGTLGSAALVYLQRLARSRAAGGLPPAADPISTTLARIENILAARDFIYLLLLLAYFDRTYEFLWAGAVGSLLFFGMMIYLRRENHEQTSQSHSSREGQARGPAARDGGGHQHLYSRH